MSKRTCPICERAVLAREENSAFPFCSSRCQLVDLGHWLDGEYRVPGEPAEVADSGIPSDSSEG